MVSKASKRKGVSTVYYGRLKGVSKGLTIPTFMDDTGSTAQPVAEDEDPLCEGAARCASVSIASLS